MREETPRVLVNVRAFEGNARAARKRLIVVSAVCGAESKLCRVQKTKNSREGYVALGSQALAAAEAEGSFLLLLLITVTI